MSLACERGVTTPATLSIRQTAVRSAATSNSPYPREERRRRALNVAVALLALVVALPLMLIIAVAIRLTSAGPVFYQQTRVGMDRRRGRDAAGGGARRGDMGGQPFTIYKFRTMYQAVQRREAWAQPEDQRVTPVGRVLRRIRLDELPQLINVLRGDMNVVGPRPEQPQIFADLRAQVDHYPSRQRVLPGITGWAQVNQGYDRTVDDVRRKLAYDLEYLGRRSAGEDARIMLRTVPVMLGRRGAW